MSESIRRKILLSVFLPLPLMAVVCGILLWQLSRWQSEATWVDHTREVLVQAHLAQRLLLDQETGRRGYLLTGQRDFLQPYESGSKMFPLAVDRLASLTSDNAAQQARIAQLRQQHAAWNTNPLDMPRDQAIAQAGARKKTMDEMRDSLGKIIGTEEQLLARRRESARDAWHTATVVAGVVLTAAAAFLTWFILRLVGRVDRVYQKALDESKKSLERERNARTAAEAIAEEVTERSREMERVFTDVRTQRDQAVRRLSELGEAHS
jgi:CHASE3 domain sensor protein